MPTQAKPVSQAEVALIRARAIETIDEGIEELKGSAHRAMRLLIGVILSCTIILIPLGLKLIWSALRNQPNSKEFIDILQRARAFVQTSEPVIAFPLMVNSILRQPGSTPATGLVITSFDPAAQSITFMTELAVALGSDGLEGLGERWTDSQRQFAENLMNDEQFQPFRRRLIPADITGGPTVYACDLMIHPALLPGNMVGEDCPFFPCLAQPGNAGLILLLPHWFITPAMITTEQKSEFLVALVHFDKLREIAGKIGA